MPSCSYHYPGSLYKVGQDEFEAMTDAIKHSHLSGKKVYQHRPDGRKFLVYDPLSSIKRKKK